jgi:general transcription factor 3C polypeptide 5 (transcription factor C subunit 1)
MELADSSTAPFYIVPHERVVSIEHPCIVRNFDNGIKSLGGEPQMKHVSGGGDV